MKRFRLIGLILMGIVFLTGCYGGYVVCTPPTIPQVRITLVIMAIPPIIAFAPDGTPLGAFGWVVLDGVKTEFYIDYDCDGNAAYYASHDINCYSSVVIDVDVECKKLIKVELEDLCGDRSHAEWVLVDEVPDETVAVVFSYW